MFSLPDSQVKERQNSWPEEHCGERLKQPIDLEMKVNAKSLTLISDHRCNQILAVLLKRFGVVF